MRRALATNEMRMNPNQAIQGLFGLTFAFTLASAWPAVAANPARSQHSDFITVKGDQLMEGRNPFRFISFNIPNLHLVEDNVAFAQANSWRLPDRYETEDALESIRQLGGRVVRTYVLSVVRTNGDAGMPCYVLGPGQFNEEAFCALDLVLQVANQKGVRLILPFVDNWKWWGGGAEYAAFRGKVPEAFWTDRQVIEDFKATIRFVLNRTNTLTGVPYREDKAILCWETGNELQSPAAWTREIAAYIKSLDKNHLVMDGYHTTQLRDASLDIPEVDIVTTHHYPGEKKSYATLASENWAKAKGRKPYVIGEFGFVETSEIAALLKVVESSEIAGALIWSLRPHSRDGGFYWHSEPAGGNKYKAYHWPGFASGAGYDEAAVLELMRQQAFAIQGLRPPKLPKPAAPRLLEPSEDAGLRWQGSAGASSYAVERAPSARGPWKVVATEVDESAVQYRPAFADTNAAPGTWYYRVRAQNGSGVSAWSGVSGPVVVRHRLLVDEMADFNALHQRQGKLELKNHDCRKAREDAHRIAGEPGSEMIYQLPGAVHGCKVYAFFPGDVADFSFAVSPDGKTWNQLEPRKTPFYSGAGDYGYWKPVSYEATATGVSGRFLKVGFATQAQVGRVEMFYK